MGKCSPVQNCLSRCKSEYVSKLSFERSSGGIALYDTFENSHLSKLQFFSSNKKFVCWWSRLVFLDDDAGVVAAEAEGIAQGGSYGFGLRFPESEVQPGVQVRVIGEVVDGWWYFVFDGAHDTGDGFDDAGRAEAVPCHAFGAADVRSEERR